MQLTVSRYGEGIRIAVTAARDPRLLGEFVVRPTRSEISAVRLVDDLVAFFGSRLDRLEGMIESQGGYSRHVGAGYQPCTASSDPGPPPHQGSSGHRLAAVTHAQADRIIALLERIEAGLDGGRAG